jgi:hypothetical protein
MTSSLRGRGGFQMMTIEDGGVGGLTDDDVTKNCQIFGRFLEISSDFKRKSSYFLKNFSKLTMSEGQFSNR